MNQNNISKAAVITSAIVEIIQLVVGIFFVFLFGFVLIEELIDGEFRASMGVDGTIAALLFVALGVWLILLSRKKSKLIKTFKSYASRLSAEPTGSIEQLAASAGTSVDVVNKNLNEMIKKKYFINAFIDLERNYIVFSQSQAQGIGNITQTNKIEHVTVSCKGCGATNKIVKGSVGECEFCGAQIK